MTKYIQTPTERKMADQQRMRKMIAAKERNPNRCKRKK